MYKTLCKHIPSFILAIIVTLCFSCDGRDTVHKSHTEILKDNKLLDSFSQHTTYIPEHYTERTVDTVLSSGFTIKIKSYTQMESAYLISEKKDSLNYKTYYRNSLANVVVSRNTKKLFNDTISKTFISSYTKTPLNTLDQYILTSVWLDDKDLPNPEHLKLHIEYCKPEHKACLTYLLTITTAGTFTLEKQ